MIPFEIVTPEGVIYKDTIDALTLNTVSGEITILSNHMPLISVLEPGEMRIKKDDVETFMAVSGGFVQVQPNSNVVIMADTAIRVEDIDEEKIEEARKKAQDILTNKTTALEVADAEASLAHAMAQMKVLTRRRKGPHK